MQLFLFHLPINKYICRLFLAPTSPRNLNLAVTSSTSIRASWLEPLKFNGILKRYVVMYGTARSKLDGRFFTLDKSYEITGLEEFTEYFVQVHAETSVSGTPSNIEQAKTLEDGKLFVFVFLFDCSYQNNVVNC